ncbi:stAR-related lipid transfer protein 4 [Crotalus adamanteus]|uniref:StAR-related lipid transfer protein 4 n=1 Tax=Crotalus adamanteus TaxID=8729 RepID=A0AAW1C150_CROAD
MNEPLDRGLIRCLEENSLVKSPSFDKLTFPASPRLQKRMKDISDIDSLATRLKNTMIQYHNIEDNEWRVARKTKDITVWRKPSEEFSGYLYKTQGIVEDVTNRIIDHIRPGPYRISWDSLMTTMDIVEKYEENCCVMRYTTAGQILNIIAPREFIDFSYTTSCEDGLLSCGISLDYGEVRPSFVRGYEKISVMLLAQSKRYWGKVICHWKKNEMNVNNLLKFP